MRKIIIGFVSLALVTAAFWAYIHFMDTAPVIDSPSPKETPDIEMPEITQTSEESGGISGVKDKYIIDGSYTVLDPDSKQVKAKYGFEKLLNPGTGQGTFRQVIKPYVILYEDSYQCRVDADEGIFQINTDSDRETPQDARLSGNVVIHLVPKTNSQINEVYIYLDDLEFSSERSEFATDGSVRVLSNQLKMEGLGLVLIFNTQAGRIEYMRIMDLDSIRIKNTGSIRTKNNAESESTPGGTKVLARRDSKSPLPIQSNQEDFYQCLIEDNVVIRYGRELIVGGASKVNIKNILLKQSSEPFDKNASDVNKTAENEQKTVVQSSVSTESGNELKTKSSQKPSFSEEPDDIVVTCDGGIVLQPIDNNNKGPQKFPTPELSVEMSGDPLFIERIIANTADRLEPLIHCGLLTYKPNEEILRLFTDTQPQIVLNASASKSRIETAGDVFWDMDGLLASIAGPGIVYLENHEKPELEPSEIAFNGMMDLIFADLPDQTAWTTIQTINLTGGMTVLLKQNGWYHTIADAARLEFGSENSLSEALLSGGVEFKTVNADEPQRAVAESAKFEFGPENSLATAYMSGGVVFESHHENKQSSAVADSAVFHFIGNKLRLADLKGTVSFASDRGMLTSSSAQVLFTPDKNGSVRPGVVNLLGEAVLQTIPDTTDRPPAKFEAHKIDYDLQTGSGYAYGPIRFTYYLEPAAGVTTIDPWIQATITADNNATFTADANRRIKQVILNENVIATRKYKTLTYEQRDVFHGETLIVDIENKDGNRNVQDITIKDGDVFANSVRTRDDQTLFQVKMDCREIAFRREGNLVGAKGPGKIELVNREHLAVSEIESGGLNFGRPCVAQVINFNEILWNLNKESIHAASDNQTLQLAYVPLSDEGKPEKYIYVHSREFDLDFMTTPKGQTSLKKVFTNKGIIYEEYNADMSNRIYELKGQTLEYDGLSGNQWLKISESDSIPCEANGQKVPYIFLNLKTGQLQTAISPTSGILAD